MPKWVCIILISIVVIAVLVLGIFGLLKHFFLKTEEDLLAKYEIFEDSLVTTDSDLVATSMDFEEQDRAEGEKESCRTPEDITDGIKIQGKELNDCYSDGLRLDTSISGKIIVRFRINPYGKVTECEVTKSTIDSRVVEKCVIYKVRHWQFNAIPECNTVVNYPFTFSLNKE